MSRARSTALHKTDEAAAVFAALGDPTRHRIVGRLCGEGPLSISVLSEDAGVTRQAVTKHLQALADAGIVHDRWQGRARIFALEPRRLARAQQYLNVVSAQWDTAIARLRAFVEDGA